MTRVKRICGLLYPTASRDLMIRSVQRLAALFGIVERMSDPLPFDFTDYYDDIDPQLSRVFLSFAGLCYAGELADWKRAAIELEAQSACGGGRRINADPGYVDGAKLVLASTKDNAQRIYLRDGIYAELTMCRRRSGWEKFFYTFPDFKSGVYDAFFDAVRADHRRDARAERASADRANGE